MKKLTFFLFAVVLSASTLSAQIGCRQCSDLDVLKSCSWTNGFEYVKYISPEITEIMGYDNSSPGENLYLFVGGTPHEGGTNLWVTQDNNHLKVADKGDYQLFPKGDLITFDSSGKLLLFRDKGSGELHGVLQPVKESLTETIELDYLRFVLAGKYSDNNGKTYQFYPDRYYAEGFPCSDGKFTFGKEYECPELILLFKGASYGVNKTADGLKLTPVELNEEDLFSPVKGGKPIFLKREKGNEKGDYPLTSEEIMTASQIYDYAGNDPYIPGTNFMAILQARIEALSTMRNEIFARHGFIFKSGK